MKQISATIFVLLVEETEAGVKTSPLKRFPARTFIPLGNR